LKYLKTGLKKYNHYMSNEHTHDPEPHAAITHDDPPGYYEILVTSIEELLIERKYLCAGEVRAQLELLDSRSPARGAMLVARAWVDPAFRARLLVDGVAAAEEFGITQYDDTEFTVLEDTEKVHHLIVCTLCSCYPRAVLGLAPDWYKNKQYRSRAVREPRRLLTEFGTIIPEDVEIRVADSTSDLRFMVLPLRPKGTENFTEEALARLVSRDTMIGVTIPHL
jgi:thiocyanate hydrolase subunit gamma